MKKSMQILGVFVLAFLTYFFLPESCPELARRTAFVFVIAALFWGFEIIPLFATSLGIVVFLIYGLSWLPLNGEPTGISYGIFIEPFASPVIMLFLGGFVIAEVFRKYHVDQLFAAWLLKRFGVKPYAIMLGFMLTTVFLSMWISNTATTALILAMIAPLLVSLDGDDKFRKALVLSVAFAANIGGMMTPIGTPPNAIAIGILAGEGIQINFLAWVLLVAPIGFLLVFLNSAMLLPFFPSKHKSLHFEIKSPEHPSLYAKEVFTIGLLTILGWLTSGWHHIPEAVISLSAVAVFMAMGLFTKDDLKRIHWDILILMWGGLALGEAMTASGLAEWIVELPIFSIQGFGLLILFCVVAVLLSTFMSNTATVNLLLPVVISLPLGSPVVLAMVIALASSLDIATPVATPPMAMAYGTGELTVKDMIIFGTIFSVVANGLLMLYFKWVLSQPWIPLPG